MKFVDGHALAVLTESRRLSSAAMVYVYTQYTFCERGK